MEMRPDFICLGAQKAGTTWLYRQFCNHPQFKMPKKELRFFHPWNPKIKLEEYKAHFFGDKLSGDMTPEYFMSKKAASEIKTLFPEVKLFVILRNPTDRAFSQYRMALNYGVISGDFISNFRANRREMATRGLYKNQLLNYSSFFELGKNLRVYLYDDLLENPKKFFSEICLYLGADDISNDSLLEWLDMKYKHDGLVISQEDRVEVGTFYSKSISELSQMLNRNICWN